MHDTIASAHTALVRGETTAGRLVADSLDAIERRGPSTNAFITVAKDRALAMAADVDATRAAGLDYGPLHGVPISIKDIIDQAGIVTTAASHVLDDRIAPADAAVVSRLNEAGAIIIGRTNLHQFALGTTSDDSAFGPVRNPHDLSRVAGGSSGGSAAAVAAGMGLASVGTDTGASVRVPAAVCGVVGLKPTFGEVPTTGVIPLSTSLDHVGPLTRTVQDAAWMWQVMSGRPLAQIAPRSATSLRVSRLSGYFDALLAPEVRLAINRAEHHLSAAGVRRHTADLDNPSRIASTYVNIVLAEAAAWHAPYLDTRTSGYSATVHDRLVSLGRTVTATAYLEAQQERVRLRAAVDRLLDEADALILPTLPIVAQAVGAGDVIVDPADPTPQPVRSVMLRLTQLFNLTGHPAVSIPVPSMGLPVGLQIVGRRHDTAGLLAVAAACESIFRSAGDVTA